jgi:hypothetical protein
MSHPQTLLALLPLDGPPITVGGSRSPREMASLAAQLPPATAPDAWLVACEGVDVVLVATLGRLPVGDMASLRREIQRTVLQGALLAACRAVIVLVRTPGPALTEAAATFAVTHEDVRDLCQRVNIHLRDLVWVTAEGPQSFALGRFREPQASITGVWPAGRYAEGDPDIPSYARLLSL